ncbi:MAG: patatin-like phospholipase family protein [Lachnospiraceae bacterium]|nr:patatin-like phospholipase family protein [Lachnospiraceae bacterium]
MDYSSIEKLLKYAGDDEEIKQLAGSILDNADKAARIVDTTLNKRAADTTHLKVINAESEKELVSAINPESVGIVLSGGGAKGAYQIGVWKALKEKNAFNIAAVSGSSVGALNGALMAALEENEAETIWTSLKEEDFLTDIPDDSKIQFSRDGLTKIINDSKVYSRIDNSKMLCVVTCFNASTGFPEHHLINNYSDNDIVDALLASSAIPIIYDSQTFKDAKYYDGGFPLLGSNTPISPLYSLGIRKFVVIHLRTFNTFKNKKTEIMLNRKILGESFYEGADFVHIFPSEGLGDLMTGTLNFDADYLKNTLELGYKDGIKIADQVKLMALDSPVETERHYANGKYFRSYEEMISLNI